MRMCSLLGKKKCLLSTSTGVRIKQIELKENVRAFSGNKENCP